MYWNCVDKALFIARPGRLSGNKSLVEPRYRFLLRNKGKCQENWETVLFLFSVSSLVLFLGSTIIGALNYFPVLAFEKQL